MKKLTTEIIALCDYATISREGKLSINGIFDELRIERFPGGMARAFFVSTINGVPNNSYKLNLRIEPSSGFASERNKFDLNAFTSQNGKSNLILEINGLGFKKDGDYKFILSQGDREVNSTTLRVRNKNNVDEVKLPN